jgi:hypothetical protein
MSATPPNHPSSEQLARFGRGDLEPAEWAEIERHLRDCPSCGQALKTLPDDAFVTRLRTCGANSDRPDESIPDAGGRGSQTRADASSAVPAAEEVPAWLAAHPRYRVLGLLGTGGMGAVYKAEHLVMTRPVALKVIGSGLLDNPATVERFRREVRAAAQLSHPNIVTAHDAEQAGDSHFLVMEYVEGTSLARLVAEKGPLPVRDACDYARQAAVGLQHAFEKGMVHRDIKPANLMLTPSGQVKVLDFGLARFAFVGLPDETAPGTTASAGQLTQLGAVMGTPDYIAPEQATDAHAADIRADIYSLGCTLYDLLTGRPPFPDGTALDKVLAHTREQPRPLTALRKDVPPALARVVERMMAKDPARRYQTPAEVAEALAPFAVDRGRPFWPGPFSYGAKELLAPYLPKTARGPRRRLLLAVAVCLLLLALGLLILQGHRKAELPPGVDRLPRAAGEVRRFRGHLQPVKCVAFTPDGRKALSASGFPTSDNTVRVWEVASGRELVCFRGHEGAVHAVAVSPDGRRALSGGEDRVLRLWDVATGKEVRQFQGRTSGDGSVAFSPDGRRALSGSWDNTVRLWEVETGRQLKCLTGHTHSVVAVAFVGDRRALSGSFDRTMRLWDLETGRELKRFEGHTQPVSGIAVSPDGRRALSTSDGVRLWDLETLQELSCFEDGTGHVESVAFSPDGRRALAGGTDFVVRLWDLQTGEKLAYFRHGAVVWSVAYSPDGRFALSGGGDNTVRLWQLPVSPAAPGP